jgi:pyridoxal phosphate enzyme (YggS family)
LKSISPVSSRERRSCRLADGREQTLPRARIAPVERATNLIAETLLRIGERIARAAKRSGRRGAEITIVGVSKTVPAQSIQAGYDAGLRHFGENRIQEWEAKQPTLSRLDATWHFIGHLQSNKARRAAHLFGRVDSVDSLSLARKLDHAAGEEGKRLQVLIEVRLSDETTKTGVSQADLSLLAETAITLPNLELLGMMTIPPQCDDPERARPYFRKLRQLRDSLRGSLDRPLPVLSMGMSHDFEVAIEEGATEIRIGTAIFGDRDATG